MCELTEKERKAKAARIIDDIATTAATTTAIFSQVPGMGVATLTKLYLDLAQELATLFNQKIESEKARSLILTACERNADAIFNKSVLGWIPLIGNAINASITFTLTENVGWFLYDYFLTTHE